LDHSLNAKRIVVGLIALYAILLQAFVGAAFPGAAFESFSGVTCIQDAAAPEAPTDQRHHHHGVCCILACAASGFAFIATACGLVVFVALLVSPLIFATKQEKSARSPLKFNFAARGPPENN
jgi:hypothetical protein